MLLLRLSLAGSKPLLLSLFCVQGSAPNFSIGESNDLFL